MNVYESRLTNHRWLMLLVMVLLLAVGAESMAQEVPDPFVAYEEAEEPPVDSSKPGGTPPSQPEQVDKPKGVDNLANSTAEGTWQFSAGTSFSFDRSTNELLDGNETTNSTYLFRFGLGFGHYLWERVLIEGTAGLMMRRLARQGNTSATEQDWVFQARGWYILPLSERLGLMTGLGLGGYFGSSTRQFSIDDSTVNEETTTAGFAGDLMAGAMYMITDAAALRVLLDFTFLLGTEDVPSIDESLSVSATHFGLGLGYSYSF